MSISIFTVTHLGYDSNDILHLGGGVFAIFDLLFFGHIFMCVFCQVKVDAQ